MNSQYPAHSFSWRARLVLVFVVFFTSLFVGQNGSRPVNTAHGGGFDDFGSKPESTRVEPATTDPEYVIGTGDVLGISIWREPEISRVIPVRLDGKISLPLIGELPASGRTPRQLEEEVTRKLEAYVTEPEVTVIVQEIKSQKVNVLGMVMKPGSYDLRRPMTVLDAIATAGGFRDFAKQKDIYVLRRAKDGSQNRLRFNYKEVVKGHNTEQNVELHSQDTVVVP